MIELLQFCKKQCNRHYYLLLTKCTSLTLNMCEEKMKNAEAKEKFNRWLSRNKYNPADYDKPLFNKLFKQYQLDNTMRLKNYLRFHATESSKSLRLVAVQDVMDNVDLISKTEAIKRYTTKFMSESVVTNVGLTFDSPYKRNALITMYFPSVLEKLWVKGKHVKVENVKAKEAAKKAVETKTAKLVAAINSIDVTIPKLGSSKLKKYATDSYVEHGASHGYYNEPPRDKGTLKRLMVNFIRHELTEYDDDILRTYNKVGKRLGIQLLRTKIYTQIAVVYPHLKSECRNQMELRYDGGGKLFLDSLEKAKFNPVTTVEFEDHDY